MRKEEKVFLDWKLKLWCCESWSFFLREKLKKKSQIAIHNGLSKMRIFFVYLLANLQFTNQLHRNSVAGSKTWIAEKKKKRIKFEEFRQCGLDWAASFVKYSHTCLQAKIIKYLDDDHKSRDISETRIWWNYHAMSNRRVSVEFEMSQDRCENSHHQLSTFNVEIETFHFCQLEARTLAGVATSEKKIHSTSELTQLQKRLRMQKRKLKFIFAFGAHSREKCKKKYFQGFSPTKHNFFIFIFSPLHIQLVRLTPISRYCCQSIRVFLCR